MRYSVVVLVLATIFFGVSLLASRGNELAVRSVVGMPCSEHADCGDNFHCISDNETKNGAKFIGGYCVKFDCSLANPCEAGTQCVIPEGRNFSLCLAKCSEDFHCREGYTCHEGGVCLPSNG